ncbi:helix-turn-helix domain-containing protein [Bacteroides sp.]|uniref:helix-turn-helix domain-containing protein n=1 Tax=Bacteroides sp. TaxID=29523 RepID=UPI0034CD569E
MIKKERGKSTQEYIQDTVLSISKDRLSDTSKSIGQVTEGLGLQHLSYFNRMFNKKVGKTQKRVTNK